MFLLPGYSYGALTWSQEFTAFGIFYKVLGDTIYPWIFGYFKKWIFKEPDLLQIGLCSFCRFM
jgi:hypothetical protein